MGHTKLQLCECGCGKPNGNQWKGGRKKNSKGYIMVLSHGHPRADAKGYVREHIRVCEQVLGYALPAHAVVHHVNEDRSANQPANLVICHDENYHRMLHRRIRAYKATGNPLSVKCKFCQKWGIVGENSMRENQTSHFHSTCAATYERDRRSNKMTPLTKKTL